jgi:ADP-heptose:LPS heptosyltransferase
VVRAVQHARELDELRRWVIPGVRNIAILRANGIGDFIFTLPALEAFRAAYPDAEIVLLGKRWHAEFLRDRPGPVDRVVVAPPCRGVTLPPDADDDSTELDRFVSAMRRKCFDLAIQLRGGGRYSNPLALRLAARLTIGLRAPGAPALDRWIPYVYDQSEIHRYLEVMSLIGAAPVTLEPRLSVTKRDRAESLAVLPETREALVVLHPGAGAPDRRWPPEKFAAAGDALADAGARVVVIGTEPERPLVEQVLSRMRASAEDLCGKLSLGGLAELLSRCALAVSNDSGPLHLAAAVGTQTVGIFWCLNMITAGIPGRRRHRPVISWQVTCPACGTDHSHGWCACGSSFVANVPV